MNHLSPHLPHQEPWTQWTSNRGPVSWLCLVLQPWIVMSMVVGRLALVVPVRARAWGRVAGL